MNNKIQTTESVNAVLHYEAPQVEIIEVAVEKGFATSGDIEAYSEGDGWS